MRHAFLLLVALLPAHAASISGIVKDPSGAVISNAAITLIYSEGSATTSSDARGHFEFADIPAATYRLAVTHVGFEAFEQSVTAAAQAVTLNIVLKVANVKTVVEVSGGRSALRNSDPNYQSLRGGAMRSVYRVKNLVLKRDTATFTFRSGSFSFLPPVLGEVTAGAFVGDGNFTLKPSLEILEKHLRQISGAGAIDEDFGAVALYFTDDTFRQITAQAELADESPKPHEDAFHRVRESLRRRDDLPRTYLERLIDADDVPNMDAEILAELYNHVRGSFRAFIHGRKNSGLRFVLDPRGAMPYLPAPDEVALLNVDQGSQRDGIWYLSHTVAELASGHASSAEDKRLIEPEHYRIETTIAKSLNLSVVCDLRFHAVRDGVRMIKFDLLPDLQVAHMRLDGKEIPFVQESRKQDGSFYVVAPEPLVRGRAYQATFEYEGSQFMLDRGGKLYAMDPRKAWYPRPNAISRATYDLTFRVPHSMTVIASGDRVKSETESGREISQWTSKTPLPIAGFNYGVFDAKPRNDETNFPIEAFIGSLPKGFFMPSSSLGLDRAENAIQVFQHWFGAPPYSHLAVTEANTSDSMAGIVFVPTISMTDSSSRYGSVSRYLGNRPAPNVAGPAFDESLPRQVARQWWGNMIDPVSFHDEWLVRGLADFSGAVYDLAAEPGTNDFPEHWKRARDLLLAKTHWGVKANDAAPLWLGTMAEPILTQRYTPYSPRRPIFLPAFAGPNLLLASMKGGYVIHMLRALMFDRVAGDKDFIAMMQDFAATFAHHSVSTEEFKWVAEKHMKPDMDLEGNKRMDWFFREWVYGTELPSYRLEYSIAKGPAGKPVLQGKLTQSGVSDSFRMRIPIYAKFGAKTRTVGYMALSGNHTGEFRVELPEEPKKIMLNANFDILCAEAEVKQIR